MTELVLSAVVTVESFPRMGHDKISKVATLAAGRMWRLATIAYLKPTVPEQALKAASGGRPWLLQRTTMVAK
jgi:hypothetical protein